MVSALFPVHVTGAFARRRGKRLLGPVDLSLDGQGTCVVIGPNGSGKTTLLQMLHGLTRLSEGQITWACDAKAARQAQAFVFQRPVMLRRTVAENLAYPLGLQRLPKAEIRDNVQIWAGRVGLSEMLERRATRLSGGEQQKLALARALIAEPDLLFLDEPTAALDGRATREIEDILKGARDRGTCLILSTHDMGQARRLADRVIFLLGGRVHEDGPGPAFFAAPQTPEARAFLKGDIVE